MSEKTKKNDSKKDDLNSQKDKDLLIKNRDEVAKALEILFASDYISRRKLYIENFIRGMMFSMGGIIGATIAIGFFLWLLSFFDSVPLVGPFVERLIEQIQSADTK